MRSGTPDYTLYIYITLTLGLKNGPCWETRVYPRFLRQNSSFTFVEIRLGQEHGSTGDSETCILHNNIRTTLFHQCRAGH